MDDWEFYQHMSDGKWSWRNVRTDSTSQSVDRFDTFIAAVGNAMLHGFEPGISRLAAVTLERRNKGR